MSPYILALLSVVSYRGFSVEVYFPLWFRPIIYK